jgi:hypothetical protein
MPIPERLQSLATRLGQLTAQYDEQTTPLNFAVGALHALAMAHALKYDGRAEAGRGRRMWQLASTIAQNLSHGGELPTAGEWLAGYYFNDAIIRIAVSFEHIVRHVTNRHSRKDNIDTLIQAATPLGFQESWGKAWRPLQDELSAIRHRNEFVDGPKIEVDPLLAVDALEQLINTLTWGLQIGPGETTS